MFAHLSNFTFGGGAPTVAAYQRELVAKRGWLTEEQFALAYSLSRITPRTNLLPFCAAAGAMLRGPRGAIVALPTAGFDQWSANR